MKLGVLTALFGDQPLEKALDYIKNAGLDAVEIGAGNYPGIKHCDPDILLKNDKELENFKKLIADHGLIISALSCHGNPLHPNKKFAIQNHEAQRKAVLLAERLGVSVVNTFSGCPGSSDSDKYPNWVTCPWPPDFLEILKWQWEEKVIPYWKEENDFAKEHGVKFALEMHPGFVVYNTETLLRLREAAGEQIGANFDPSHLFWQGIDPIASIRKLGKAIFHIHAKDTRICPYNTPVNGVLDTKHYGDEINRSWIFRTIGYGHDYSFWKDFVSNLRMVGYDGVLSIEHEDSLMSANEGLMKAVSILKQVLLTEELGKIWWA
ncbi:sugar phosphate isomerase/epimerase [Candidatus Poribacteria bacterium]|nr:sugar phosphate isomerase/epimerase [Candidatus Poribacteria bacterium]